VCSSDLLKTLLERLRPLDQKLQYQVDKLLRTAALAESGVSLQEAAVKGDGMLYKANIENMVMDEGDAEEESDES
jgi:U3 small nucleolar ribonucleoprotein protein LCP5